MEIGKDQQVCSSGEHVVRKGQRTNIMKQSAFKKQTSNIFRTLDYEKNSSYLPGKSFSRTFHSCCIRLTQALGGCLKTNLILN
jgi:hypothetical protein